MIAKLASDSKQRNLPSKDKTDKQTRVASLHFFNHSRSNTRVVMLIFSKMQNTFSSNSITEIHQRAYVTLPGKQNPIIAKIYLPSGKRRPRFPQYGSTKIKYLMFFPMIRNKQSIPEN